MELEEGIVRQDIQTMTAGKPMDPTLSIQDVLDENHMPVPQMEQIHVLAVPPVISTTSKPTRWLEKVKTDVKSAIRKERPDVFVIPRCSPLKAEELVEELGYENEDIDVVEDEDSSIDPYPWESDLAEDHEGQRKGYMQYFKDNLHGVLSEGGSATIPPGISTSAQPKYHLKDTSQMASLLYLKTSRLPFGLEGTADLMIIGEVAHSMNDIFADLQFVIKIKKNQCGPKERKELLLELVAANWKSYSPCAPIGLLSNLNDYWYFMWFTPDRKITRMKLSCLAKGDEGLSCDWDK
ncbi:hypothetical protein DVH05_024781 [Phytophthora capsici]|nr:hypothetical protein DVH05_024781 [Phytophthora capsici]